MYCRRCLYDLRGQEVPRCPECGRPYDPDDTATYLRERLGWPRRVLQLIRRRRILLIVLLTLALIVACWRGRRELRYAMPARIHPGRISACNAKEILTEWHIQQADRPSQRCLDFLVARRDASLSYSATTEFGAARHAAGARAFLVYVRVFAPLLIIYVAGVGVLMGRRATRPVCGVIVVLACACLASYFQEEVIRIVWPGSHAFLADYIYVCPIDVTRRPPRSGQTVALYERVPTAGSRRIVGFTDGHAEALRDKKLAQLLQAQGAELAEDIVPTDE